MSKLGDVKQCRLCEEGETAMLKLIPASSASFSEPDAHLGEEVPEQLVWECSVCGDREAFNGTLD
jgi:hypothetical protein